MDYFVLCLLSSTTAVTTATSSLLLNWICEFNQMSSEVGSNSNSSSSGSDSNRRSNSSSGSDSSWHYGNLLDINQIARCSASRTDRKLIYFHLSTWQ